jgi:hypothetical protein
MEGLILSERGVAVELGRAKFQCRSRNLPANLQSRKTAPL